ncbi:acetolactate synthase small subunit, partial [Selenomonas sp. F0473]
MKHILSVFVENQTGVLVRVASMFSRREFNIDSLSVGVTESPAFSRITVVVHGDENLVEQMIKQLEKMPVVRAVQRLDEKGAACRGMTMIKVRA